jgi:predicted dehydrogenase
VAVVGAGYWGPNLIRNFLGSADADLRWVCDLDQKRAERVVGRYGSVRVTTALAEVLADPLVDAVAICTPPGSHRAIASECLLAGRDVLVEKPLATSVADGTYLVDLARREERVIMCDHTFCYTPVVNRIRSLLGEGSLGELYYVDSIRMNLGLVQSDVDVLWDLATHDLSVLDYILPAHVRPVSVSAHGADPIGAGKSCVGYLTIPLSNGAIVHVSVNWLSPSKIRQTVIAGSRSMVIWDDMKPYQRLTVVDCGVDLGTPATDDARNDLMVSYRVGDMIVPALNETSEALQSVVQEFVSAVKERRTPRTDGVAGVHVLELLEAADRSIATGGVLVPLRPGPEG